VKEFFGKIPRMIANLIKVLAPRFSLHFSSSNEPIMKNAHPKITAQQ
jgi:hypothetical protein